MAGRIEVVGGLEEIDFEEWHEAGVDCLLVDMEGTVAPYGTTEVSPEAVAAFQAARDLGHISRLGIVTHKKDLDVVRDVAGQIGADGYFVPRNKSERKPSPALLQRAMDEFKAKPDETGMAGDKWTADVMAGKNAGVKRIAWVARYGKQDHPGDRYFRRPYELPRRIILSRRGPLDI